MSSFKYKLFDLSLFGVEWHWVPCKRCSAELPSERWRLLDCSRNIIYTCGTDNYYTQLPYILLWNNSSWGKGGAGLWLSTARTAIQLHHLYHPALYHLKLPPVKLLRRLCGQRRKESYATYVYKVLLQVHPVTGLLSHYNGPAEWVTSTHSPPSSTGRSVYPCSREQIRTRRRLGTRPAVGVPPLASVLWTWWDSLQRWFFSPFSLWALKAC